MAFLTKYVLDMNQIEVKRVVFRMGAVVFLLSLDGSFMWGFYGRFLPIGAVTPAEETRLQGVTVVMLILQSILTPLFLPFLKGDASRFAQGLMEITAASFISALVG